MVIEICKKEDRSKLVEFLRNYWKSDHILVKYPEFLEWQHGNEDGGLNFMIAKDDQNEILAIYGIIPLSHHDASLPINNRANEAWGAIWKIRPDCKVPGLGVLVLRRVAQMYDFICGIGLSDMSKSIYKCMKCPMGDMSQYYVLNDNIKEFKIAEIKNRKISSNPETNCNLLEINNLDSINLIHAYHPIKTVNYLQNRYVNHPVYNYHFLGCYVGEILKAILVIRYIQVEDRQCVRIVDLLGSIEGIIGLGNAIRKYLAQFDNVEYFDMYNYGLPQNELIEGGFELLDYNSSNIIPNYFEPFLKKNIPLQFFYLTKHKEKKYVLFKGDSDQDRPNFMK